MILRDVPDNTRVKVTLANINGTGQTVSASMGFLVGDVDSSRSVIAADIAAIKSHAG